MRTTLDTFETLSLTGSASSSVVFGYSPAAADDELRLMAEKLRAFGATIPGNRLTSIVESLKRDDIVKVTPVDGWRKPTPYAATWNTRTLIGTSATPRVCVAATPTVLWNGRYWINYNANCTRDSALVGFNPAMLPAPSSNTENALLAKCYSQIKDKTLDVGMLILDTRENFGTVLSVLKKLRAIVEAVRHKDVGLLHKEFGFKTRHFDKKSSKYTKDAGSLWLEALYGIRPIILDLYNIVELIDKQLREKDFLMVARASDTSERTVIGSQFATVIGSGLSSCEFVGDIVAKQSVALWFSLDRPGLALAASLGLTNPVSWLYEKTPLSFVLDWLLPFGQVISQLDSTLGFTYKGGSGSFRSEGRGMIQAKSIEAIISPGMSLVVPPLSLDGDNPVVTGSYSRKVFETPPTVGLFVKDPFSVSNVVTTVALIAGRTVR